MNKYLLGILIILFVASCVQEVDKSGESIQAQTSFEDAPQWSQEVVWYQIFVETFRNGDPTNDPTIKDIAGSYPGFSPESWHTTPWTQDWYKPDDYFADMDGQHDLNGLKVAYFGQKGQQRHYGGDLQGVLDKLDYMDSLGITAVYFNPLNDAPSNHKYDARYWRHIDRNFGPDPQGDVKIMSAEIPDDPLTWKFTEADKLFLRLIDEFHRRGIKVIMDYSWNHVGETFWAWQDVSENQQDSKYRDWFWVNSYDDPDTPENEFEYPGWFGVHELILVKETEFVDHLKSSHTFEGNFHSEGIKQHIFNITRRWLDPDGNGDPSEGVDGFRLDVAAEVPLGFWREYRKVVRETNPDAYLVGESWFAIYPDSMMNPEPFLKGDVFDGVMNYRWYKAAREFFIGESDLAKPSTFVSVLKHNTSNLRDQNNRGMMNVAASHDTPRLHTSLFNKQYKYKTQTQPPFLLPAC